MTGNASITLRGRQITDFRPGKPLSDYRIHYNFEKGDESFDEARTIRAGETVVAFDAPFGRVGLSVCYDLRFPELFRSYAARGAGVILLPSEWPHPRLEHWRTLVRARAIEDQCFFIACNRVGADRNNRFCGHSMVVDPWGATLVEGDEEPGLLLATLDLSTVAEVRERMSVLRDRRPELY